MPQPHTPIRPVVLDLIAQAQAAAPGDPMSDEEYFLAQLRAAVAGGGAGRVERLRASYGLGRTDRLCRLYARYTD